MMGSLYSVNFYKGLELRKSEKDFTCLVNSGILYKMAYNLSFYD